MQHLIDKLERVLDNVHDEKSITLIADTQSKLEKIAKAIKDNIKDIEKWCGDAYQINDEIGLAIDNIKSVIDGRKVLINEKLFKDKISCENERPKVIGELFYNVDEIPLTLVGNGEVGKDLILNWHNVNDMFDLDDSNKFIMGAKEEFINIPIEWY